MAKAVQQEAVGLSYNSQLGETARPMRALPTALSEVLSTGSLLALGAIKIRQVGWCVDTGTAMAELSGGRNV